MEWNQSTIRSRVERANHPTLLFQPSENPGRRPAKQHQLPSYVNCRKANTRMHVLSHSGGHLPSNAWLLIRVGNWKDSETASWKKSRSRAGQKLEQWWRALGGGPCGPQGKLISGFTLSLNYTAEGTSFLYITPSFSRKKMGCGSVRLLGFPVRK